MSLLTLTTLISAAVATVATGIAWRLWREARIRAVARTRALEVAIDGRVDSGESMTAWPTSGPNEPTPPVEDLEHQPLFASAVTGGHAARRLGPAVAVGALVVSSAVAVLLFLGGSLGSATEAARPTPIDLLSMRHVSENRDFVVTGLVRNPEAAEAREGVNAVVFFFDGKGTFITSAKAPLDVAKLGPGEESPFQVKVPRPVDLERYRLSFRLADGSVLPHVDQREVK